MPFPDANILYVMVGTGYATVNTIQVFEAVDAIQGGIKLCFDLVDGLRAGVAVENISPPKNALAVHIGQGSVLVQWDEPDFGVPGTYEFAVSFNQTTWYNWRNMQLGAKSATLTGLPVARDIYVRMRAISTGNTPSDYTDVAQGKLQQPQVRMSVRSVKFSVIQANAVFAAYRADTNTLVAFRAPNTDTTIQ